MAEGIIGRVTDRLKQALDGLFDDPAPSSPIITQKIPQKAPNPTNTISKSRVKQPQP